MGSPKRSKDQAASLNQAVISNEIHNSNLTASLSLGNAQRKSWMSGSQTPFAMKFSSFKKTSSRVKPAKATPKPHPLEQLKADKAKDNGTPEVSNFASEDIRRSESLARDLSSGAQPFRDTEEPLPTLVEPSDMLPAIEPTSKQLPTDLAIASRSRERSLDNLDHPISIESDRLSEDDKQAPPAQPELGNTLQDITSRSAREVSVSTSPPVLADDDNIQADTSSTASYDMLSTDKPTLEHSVSTEKPASVCVGRRPSILLIPPVRRPSLDLGITPPSGSSEAQSPYDCSVGPTTPALTTPSVTSPVTELSPVSWSGALKRVHDAQHDFDSSSKRHQPPAAIDSDLAFWEFLNAAFKAQGDGSGLDIRRIMMQCDTNITEVMMSRIQSGGRGDIEQPRLDLLRKACRLHDYSFLMIHQLFCYSGIASLNPLASRMSVEDRKALSILNTFLASNSDLHQNMVVWFSKFPGTSPAVKSVRQCSADLDLWYRAALSTVHGIAARWAGPNGLHSMCMNRRFPPLISEMQNSMNVFSRVLQEVIFTAMLRNLMPAQDPRFAQHEAVFKRDLQISWGLRLVGNNNGMTCAEEHFKISMSQLPSAGSISIGRPMSTLAVTGNIYDQAIDNDNQQQDRRSSDAPQSTPPILHYNPQVMWPKGALNSSSPLQIPPLRRFSAQDPTLILPSNATVGDHTPAERNRHQSLSTTSNSNASFSRDGTTGGQQHRNSVNPTFTFIPSNSQSSSIHSIGATLTSQGSPPMHLSHTLPLGLNHHEARRNQRQLQWQNYDPAIAIGLHASSHVQQRNTQRPLALQQVGLGQMATEKPRATSPKVDCGTVERCFRYIKHIYKPTDILSAANTQYQQKVFLPASETDMRARNVEVKRVMTTLLYPGTLTFRVRCLKLPSGRHFCSDEDWVCAEQYWPMSIAILVNDVSLTLQRKSAHGKDLPVDITMFIREGVNTLSVATFSMPKHSPEQYLVGIEAVETVTYTQIKSHIQALPLEAAKKRITSKMGSDDPDIEILDPSINVDLTDPFSSVIFVIPARGVSCSHDQCFDLDTFLSTRMGSGGSKNGPCPPEEFRCPICKGDARPSKIVVDDFFRMIRATLEEMDRMDVKAIKLDINGNWVIKEEIAPTDDDDTPQEEKDKLGFASPTSDAIPGNRTSRQAAGSAPTSKPIEIIDLD